MSVDRDVSSLPISDSLIACLKDHGFRSLSDFSGMGLLDIAQELGIKQEAAHTIFEAIEQSKPDQKTVRNTTVTVSALDITKSNDRFIITFSRNLDGLLGGGIPLGQITGKE